MGVRNEKGITLIETIVVVVIISITIIIVFAFFSSQSLNISMNKATAEVAKNGETLSSFVRNELQSVKQWRVAEINRMEFKNPDGVIEYEFIAGTPEGKLVRRVNGDPSSENVMAPNIETIEFHYFASEDGGGTGFIAGTNELDPNVSSDPPGVRPCPTGTPLLDCDHNLNSIGIVEVRFVARSTNPVHPSSLDKTIQTDNPMTNDIVETDGRIRRQFSVKVQSRNLLP